ncbi:unnamed protein product [Soboliphyme baturini]|uniref:TPR_REGION domain-containing protein n=1 Tax=Soboliphyme baturini TaxID=241478 RepID=A0A183J7I4_9BILA|nr:unnamed protein product [Soboliphyme baturini]
MYAVAIKKLPFQAYESAAKRLMLENKDCVKVVPELRKKSRREYLKKREVDKVEELEADIEDEVKIFSGERLTKREKADFEYRNKVLHLAKEYKKAGDIEKAERYYMPVEAKNVSRRYVEVDTRELGPGGEQRKWEEEKLMNALIKFGAQDAKQKRRDGEFELVLEDTVDFVKALQMPGNVEVTKIIAQIHRGMLKQSCITFLYSTDALDLGSIAKRFFRNYTDTRRKCLPLSGNQ